MAVSDDDDDVKNKLFQELLHFGSANFLWLVHRKICGERDFLHRRNRNPLAAAARAVGLGDDGEDLEIGFGEEML